MYRDVVDIKHGEVFYAFDLLKLLALKKTSVSNNRLSYNPIQFCCTFYLNCDGVNFPLLPICPTNGKHRFLCVSIIHETISMIVKNNKNVAPLSLILTLAKIHEMPI